MAGVAMEPVGPVVAALQQIMRLASARLAITAILLSSIAALLLLEAAARLLVEPSERGYGRLGGVDLPPIRIVTAQKASETEDRDATVEIVTGDVVTLGDLWGLWELDPMLGYVPQPDRRSANGWWQSNNLGARARAPTAREPAPGRRRVLVFGDSYAHGSRLPQEEVWTTVLERLDPSIEAVNLAADGYSMAQAYLRYRGMRDAVAHHVVVLVLVPAVDLWRDVNVIRDLAQFWDLPYVLPRAILEDGSLRIVPPFYSDPEEVRRRDHPHLSDALVAHLRRYDRFYFPARYEAPPIVGRSVLYKVAAAAYASAQERAVWRRLWKPDWEAVRVTSAIVAAMREDVVGSGADFLAIMLPTEYDIARLREDGAFAARWRALVRNLCGEVAECQDLAPILTALDPACVDRGRDGSHYGPKLNGVLAEAALAQVQTNAQGVTTDGGPCGLRAAMSAGERAAAGG
jgi:hypothetical protein